MPRAWYFGEKAQDAAKRLAVFLGALVVCGMLLRISWVAGAFHVVQGEMYAVAHAIARTASRIFANEESTVHQLDVCTEQLASQVVRNTALASAEDEVSQWRQLFAYERQTAQREIAARIIARGALASSDVRIDRGSNASVAKGNAVVIGGGFLLGTVIDVSETQSTVRLIEDPRSAVMATIYGQSKTIGLVVGNEGAVLTLQYIPQDASIAVGDSVVTSGLGDGIPEGLPIGIVESVTTEESAPFVTATISPIHDPRTWNAVLVVQQLAESL